MTAAIRHTPTQSNLEADDGVSYENDVNAEVAALWAVGAEWAASVGGTANAITFSSDGGVVGAALAIGRPKTYWLVPLYNNTSAVTVTGDGLGPYAVVDKDGGALVPNALVAGRLTALVFDGAQFRLPIASGGTGTPASVNSVNNGRLSAATGVFVPTTSILAATSVYWTIGGLGNQIALYDGIASWISVASPEKSVPLTQTQTGTTSNGSKVITGLTDTSQLVAGQKASGTGVGVGAVISTVDSPTQVTLSVNSTAGAAVSITFKCPASTVYDVVGVLTSGALKLLLIAWTNATTRAVALTTQDGIWVLSSTIPAGIARYLGTICITATDGQTEFSFGGANTPANLLVWNEQNRRRFQPFFLDAGAPYTYNSATPRPAGGSSSFRITYVAGLAEDQVIASYQDFVSPAVNGAARIGIGLDSTSAFGGTTGYVLQDATAVVASSIRGFYCGIPAAGSHFFEALEQADGTHLTTFHETNRDASTLTVDLTL
jgi:hypothetical protein